MTATLQDRLREAAKTAYMPRAFGGINLLLEAAAHIERLEAASPSHPPVTVRGEPMACPCGKCAPSGPVVVYGELQGYFGER